MKVSPNDYDKIIISYSAGKDSLACILQLLELGVPKSKMELWHQSIDGEPGTDGLMDWPCTDSYVKATGEALGINTLFQWKVGGFEGEMLRNNAPTAAISFQMLDGSVKTMQATRSKPNTRRKFPQVSADLRVRWCSAYLKIDVAARAINNDPRFKNSKILFLTGERRQESSPRSKYKNIEPHRCNNQKRKTDQYRSVIDWSEQEVWDIIKRWNIVPHPAYFLGWGRVSCLACIFGNPDQWASIKKLAPGKFNKILGYEKEFGLTIKKGVSVEDQASQGTPYRELGNQAKVSQAMSTQFNASEFFLPEGQQWKLPAGAFKTCGAPP